MTILLRRWVRCWLLWVLVGLLLAILGNDRAVASSPSSTVPASVPSACALLTSGDLQAVFGGKVGAGALLTGSGGRETICGWTVAASPTRGFGVQLDVHTNRSAADFKEQRMIASGKTATVKKVGDAAFSERAVVGGQVFDDLWVRKGTVAFRVEVVKDVGSGPLKKLAALVVNRL